ncbi:phytoene/squalene synthase family protein [candidate division KSB1 bacterium]|nr:phytoene/squalene synthase family protein [candidate division KSB1 bacterium]
MQKYWCEKHVKAAFDYARMVTKHHAKSFYFSARFLPPNRRWAAYALYHFCRHADNLIDLPRGRSRDQLLQEVACLRKELTTAYQAGESEHAVIKPFMVIAKKFAIPIEYPLDLLNGVEMDICFKRFNTFEQLYVFCYRVAGVVGLMMTHILGYNDDRAFHYAEKLGIAMQLTNILRDIQEDKNMGRIYFPEDEMQRFEVREADISEERLTPELKRLIEFQAQRAHDYFARAATGIPMLTPASQFAIYSAGKIYQSILYRLEQRGYDPFQGRVYVPTWQKVAILLREKIRRRRSVADS